MKRGTVLILAIALIIITVALLALFAVLLVPEGSVTHTYRYDVTLDFDASVSNVTFIVPLPVAGAGTIMEDAIAGGGMTGVPAGWNLTVLTAGDTAMLRITAADIVPAAKRTPVALPEGAEPISPSESPDPGTISFPVRMEISVPVEDPIATDSPIGGEYLLSPSFNLTTAPCSFPYPEDRAPLCYRYDSRIYAGYDAEGETTVTIRAGIEGSNTWWAGGWTGNAYRDAVTLTLTGEQQGWHRAEGSLVAREGVYRWP
jgi:hypothetical protein